MLAIYEKLESYCAGPAESTNLLNYVLILEILTRLILLS